MQRAALKEVDSRSVRKTIFFALPALMVYCTFSVAPLAETLRLSFFDTTQDPYRFTGLENFTLLLSDPTWVHQFSNALWNNCLLFLVHLVVQNPIALMLAALTTNISQRASTAYRNVYFIPAMISVVVVGFVWQLILSPIWGITPMLLDSIGLSHIFMPWLGLEESALITISLISVWQNVGLPLLLFYAALISIPRELFDAARLDGLGEFSIFWKIKVPLILPTIGIINILTFIGNFTLSFDLIYALQGGLAGPNFSTDVIGTFLFRTFFGFQSQLGNLGLGACIATLLFLLILSVVSLYLVFLQSRLRKG